MISLFDQALGYLHQLISLFRRWSSYFGLALEQQNFEDTFYQLLHDKNYDEALKLALQNKNLDIDLVYKCKWRNSGITIQLINNVMGKIQDKLWAINECVQTVPMSYESCRCLIEFGLREANLRLLYELGNEPIAGSDQAKHGNELISRFKYKRQQDQEKLPLLNDDIQDDAIIGLVDFDHMNDQQRELCRCRQNLIRHEHSLEAYENILGDYRTVQQDFDHVFYDEFRRKPPLESCIEFANSGDPHAVEICLDYYTDDLKPHLLAILSNIPETLSPYQYRNLLPCLRETEKIFQWRSLNGSTELKDKLDWSSRDKTSLASAYLKDRDLKFEREFYEKDEQLKKFYKPMNSELLTEWFIQRALQIEERTLLSSNAIHLLDLGIKLGVRNIEDVCDNLAEFYRIVYDCFTESKIYLSYSEFQRMSTKDKFNCTTDTEAKYGLLALALAKCDDQDSIKILDYIICMRKRDIKIHRAYCEQYL